MRRPLLSIALAGILLSPRANAQTTVYNTFGPADSFNAFVGYTIYSEQWLAVPFAFGGQSGDFLSMIRVAATLGNGTVGVSFLAGSTIGTATTLESWSLSGGPTFPGQIYSLTSLNAPVLSPGLVYWLMLSSANNQTPNSQWLLNDHDLAGQSAFSNNGGGQWNACFGCLLPTFDITSAHLTAAPEPTTIALITTGLVVLAAVGHRRRRVILRRESP
jgi:hypothetical protein